jgi:hypothetical protein
MDRALFTELKNQIGLRRLRLRGLKFCSRAILHGSGCAKYEAISPLPQPDHEATAPGNRLVGARRKLSISALLTQ